MQRPAVRRAGLRRALLEAARARRQEALAAGFLHDLNGPLNNVNLTLTLLDAALRHVRDTAPGDPLLARCQRHLDLLHAESLRLQQWSRTVGAVLIAPAAGEPRADLVALLAEVQRMVRHQAALHEVTLAVAAPEGVEVAIEPWQLRLLLLDVLAALVEVAAPGTIIELTATAAAPGAQGEAALARLHCIAEAASAADARAAFDAAAAFDPEGDRPLPFASGADASDGAEVVMDLVAARLRADALGANVALTHDGARVRIELLLPRATHV